MEQSFWSHLCMHQGDLVISAPKEIMEDILRPYVDGGTSTWQLYYISSLNYLWQIYHNFSRYLV